MHGVFKCRTKSIGWKLKEIIRGSYQILNDLPARRMDYQTVTGSDVYSLNQTLEAVSSLNLSFVWSACVVFNFELFVLS